MRLFHISHTDLDGFACQLITNDFFKKKHFYNANYGTEVKLALKKAILDMRSYKNEKLFLMITDLSLSLQESQELDEQIQILKDEGFDIALQLLDHHITGRISAENYNWYFLDNQRCATKIVYDFMIEKFNANISYLKSLVDTINAVDIWLEYEKKNFEFGKVLMSMMVKTKEINSMLFANLHRELKFFLLKNAIKYIGLENAHIKLDNDVHFLKKEFLKDKDDDTLDNLSAKYLVKCLDTVKDELTIFYKGQKGLLTYCLGSISIPANSFLKANDDYDFFVDINRKGNASFRANGKLDVSQLALKLANGGGHINASGCKFNDFLDTIDFLEVKTFIQNKLDNLS